MSVGALFMIAHTVSDLLEHHVTTDFECLDRIYLNAYQPMLQTGGGVAVFFKWHRDQPVPSPTLMAPMSHSFKSEILNYVKRENLELVHFNKGDRKDDITLDKLSRFYKNEGVLYVGVAQEKFSTFRVTKRYNEQTGKSFPWLYRSPVMCNQYYFYIVDDDFGPLFIKFSNYFPYTARICLNGHEYVKRQLEKRGIEFEALDNGLLSCSDIKKAQNLSDKLDEKKIDKVVRKWFARLPHPFTPADRKAGYLYELSMLQVEFARTQVFDKSIMGRYLFEEIIKENLDLGRPSQVSLIFDRRVTKRTPSQYRTRVVTKGVTPSLHVSYKHSKIKQYFKEDKALRTETTINCTLDFDIGKKLCNLPKLREIGFNANRRLLDVQKISQDCRVGAQVFDDINHRREVDNQIASALKFGDARVMALMQAIQMFCLLPEGFSNSMLREKIAPMMGLSPEQYSQGKMSYDLRRLKLHGLIERIPYTHRYQITQQGTRISIFYSKIYSRVIRGGLSQLFDGFEGCSRTLLSGINQVERGIDELVGRAKISA